MKVRVEDAAVILWIPTCCVWHFDCLTWMRSGQSLFRSGTLRIFWPADIINDCVFSRAGIARRSRLFTIYMGKLVGPWFGQLIPKIQDWHISSRICIYYLYKSGILHNLGTPRTSTVRHYWPICWSTLDRHISWLSVDMLLDTRSICWPVHWPTYQLTCQLTLDRVSAWSTVM